MLVDACELLLDRYRGDLRRLRAEAGRDPRQERRLLVQVRGLGEVGVDIFFRRPRSPGRSCSRSWTGGPPRPPAGSVWTPTPGCWPATRARPSA
jgi:hypothetical protein